MSSEGLLCSVADKTRSANIWNRLCTTVENLIMQYNKEEDIQSNEFLLQIPKIYVDKSPGRGPKRIL